MSTYTNWYYLFVFHIGYISLYNNDIVKDLKVGENSKNNYIVFNCII